MEVNSSVNASEACLRMVQCLPKEFLWTWMVACSLAALIVVIQGELIKSYLKKKPPSRQSFMDLAHLFLISTFQSQCIIYFIGERLTLTIWPDPGIAIFVGLMDYSALMIMLSSMSFNSVTHLLFVMEAQSMLGMVANEKVVMKVVKHSIIWPWIFIAFLFWLADKKPVFYYMVTRDPLPKLPMQLIIITAMVIINFVATLLCKIIIWRKDELQQTFGNNHLFKNKVYFILTLTYIIQFAIMGYLDAPTFLIPSDFTFVWGNIVLFSIVIMSHRDLKQFVTRKIKRAMLYSDPMYSVND